MLCKEDVKKLLDNTISAQNLNREQYEAHQISFEEYSRAYDFCRGARTILELVLNEY